MKKGKIKHKLKGGGPKKSSRPLLLRGQTCERPTRLYIDYDFAGVLQYDSGPPKHALELKKKSGKLCPKGLNVYGLEPKVQ